MKIIYSPFYGGGYYIDLQQRKASLLGLKVCGSQELLSELELRAGVVSHELSEPERLVDFHKALSEHIAHTIFEPSFKNDEIGVSRQLMEWSDNLLMEGWTPESDIDSPKLKDLAKIVKGVTSKHISARWKDLAAYASSHPILHIDDCIEVHDKDQIPAVIKTVLDVLAKQTTVSYVPYEGDIPSDFKVYHFKTRSDAYQWYLSQPDVLSDVDVTISSDNCILNDMAIAMGKPTVNSRSQNSNPQLLQLFKLGLSLFARPLNVYNLLSYLQVPGNPLGGVSYKLARVLADEGGINEEWQKTIDEYDFTDEKGKDKRDDKLAFIDMIKKDYSPKKILVSDVRTYSDKLAHWCDKLLLSKKVDDERKEQLIVLAAFCRSLRSILPNDGYISSDELKAHVDGIYRPQSFTHMKAQKNSPDIISDITQLVDPAPKVCWLGCVGASICPYPFDFLNQSEYEGLKDAGVTIPAKSDFYTQRHQLQMAALKTVASLILVTWEFDGNARQEEHPLVAELKQLKKEEWNRHVRNDEKPNLQTVDGEISSLESKPSYRLSEDMTKLHREEESYSSVTSLIQHPFDYTMQYLLKLREPQVGQLPDLDTTKGFVAHLLVETLVKKYHEQLADEYLKLADTDIQQMINECILQKGAILMLPEYRIVRQQFEAILKDSIRALVSIIKELNLKPLDSEVELNVTLETIGAFTAKIDLLLKDTHDKYVIFDLKWSESKSYQERLEQNKAMQLELYSRAIKEQYGSDVAGVAYYLFPKMTLYTTDYPTSDHVRQIKVKAEASDRELFEEIKNSYEYRRDTLDNGFIEESELTEIAELAYTKASTDDKPLYPIEADYNDKKKKNKGCPYIKKDKPPFVKQKANWSTPSDPKEIMTTHPILKGRLV